MINSAQKTIGISVAVLLLVPFFAMQLTKEVNWSGLDFVLMGFLLTVVGFTCEYFYRKIANRTVKIALIISVLILFLLIWAELAVGIFNSPISGS